MENDLKRDDLIRRSDAENVFRSARRAMKPENYSGQEFFIRDNILLNAEQIVHSIPAVDAVEVCHCADCRYGTMVTEKAMPEMVKCSAVSMPLRGKTFFCAYGQRREDGDGDA